MSWLTMAPRGDSHPTIERIDHGGDGVPWLARTQAGTSLGSWRFRCAAGGKSYEWFACSFLNPRGVQTRYSYLVHLLASAPAQIKLR